MRFSNNLSNQSCCGIESAINPALVDLHAIPPEDPLLQKSFIDWCFYGDRCPPDPIIGGSLGGSYWNITSITNYTDGGPGYAFKIDTLHAEFYNVTDWINHTHCPTPSEECVP